MIFTKKAHFRQENPSMTGGWLYAVTFITQLLWYRRKIVLAFGQAKTQ